MAQQPGGRMLAPTRDPRTVRNVRIGQIGNPYDTIPVQRYGGIGRVVDSLHTTLGVAWTVATVGSSGERVVAASSRAAEAMVDTAHRLTDVDVVITHHPEVAQIAANIYGPSRVVEVLHMPLSPQDVEHYRRCQHRIIGVSNAQLVPLWPHRPDAVAIWNSTPTRDIGAGGGNYAVWVGRWSPEKGVLDALAAAQQLGVELHLVGGATNDDEQAWFEQAVTPLLGPTVVVHGMLTAPARDEVVGDAIAMLVPSRCVDSFGLVTAEAAMLGTPVLGYPGGATRELLALGLGRVCHGVADLSAGLADASAGLFDRAAVHQVAVEHFSPAVQAEAYTKQLLKWFAT